MMESLYWNLQSKEGIRYQNSTENSMQLRRITVRVIPGWWWFCSNPGSFMGI